MDGEALVRIWLLRQLKMFAKHWDKNDWFLHTGKSPDFWLMSYHHKDGNPANPMENWNQVLVATIMTHWEKSFKGGIGRRISLYVI